MPCIALVLYYWPRKNKVKIKWSANTSFSEQGRCGCKCFLFSQASLWFNRSCFPLLPSCAVWWEEALVPWCSSQVPASPSLLVALVVRIELRPLALNVPEQEVSSALFWCKKYLPRGKFTMPFFAGLCTLDKVQRKVFYGFSVASVAEIL